MRFPGGELRLVDFGACQHAGRYCAAGHSLRYCAPELARAVTQATMGGMGEAALRVEASLDVWAVGLVLYELFTGEGAIHTVARQPPPMAVSPLLLDTPTRCAPRPPPPTRPTP